MIYLWLLVSAGMGLWRRRHTPAWDTSRGPLALSVGLGALWLPVAVQSPVGASLLIWVMLVPALVALFRAPKHDTLWAAAPLGLYAGWLSAASCVSLGLLAAGYGYTSETTAAFAFIFLALVIASAVQNQLGRTPSYGIAVI